MGISITEKILSRSGNTCELQIILCRNSNEVKPAYSNKVEINDRVMFHAMFWDLQYDTVQYFVKFTKIQKNDKLDYKILTSLILTDDEFTMNKDFITASDDSWQSMGNTVKVNYYSATYIMKFVTKIAPQEMSCASIYEDIDLTDCELRGKDGSVKIHKAVAAACSPFFRTLFNGSWKESAGGVIEVPDISLVTLKYLKEYIYSGKVPESDDLRQLLLLSSCYMMTDLQSRCVYELSIRTTAQTVYDLIEFAVEHKQYQLLFSIMEMVKHDDLSLDDIKTFYNC